MNDDLNVLLSNYPVVHGVQFECDQCSHEEGFFILRPESMTLERLHELIIAYACELAEDIHHDVSEDDFLPFPEVECS